MSDTSHRAFFGDRECTFRLSPAMIRELERVTRQGIGGFIQRLFAYEFHHDHMVAVIRLALVGGGMAHEEADRLVRNYATELPIQNVYPLASEILRALWEGPKPASPDTEDESAADQAPGDDPVADAPPPVDPFTMSHEDRERTRLRNGYGDRL
ncbi:MAG: hypothetical protein FD152_836 [Xanthobacteraceae bacterium]|nr:MAG: hypothetical protein FD152_836 [Xanthobacteraceae bacterium]